MCTKNPSTQQVTVCAVNLTEVSSCKQGLAVAQVVSRLPLTMWAWVELQDNPHRICGAQNGTTTRTFSPVRLIPPLTHTHI